jgi:hypothetical protein
MRMLVRVLAASLVAAVSCIAAGAPHAVAQSPPQVAPSGQKLGDACARKSDSAPGVVKRDACGRWYCGRTDVKDIIELRPNLAADLGCVWQLEGQRCRCVRNFSLPKPG